MTKKSRMRESVDVISSTTPSAKYASGASPRLSNGMIAIEGYTPAPFAAADCRRAVPCRHCRMTEWSQRAAGSPRPARVLAPAAGPLCTARLS